MAGERSRRSARARRSPKDDDSDDPEMSAALQLTRLDGGGLNDQTKESDRLAKIQEKNRKAQQKFRERRKEKMLTMEREIQDLNNAVRQLRAEKDQLQEQLAVEKRVNSENSAKLETKPTTLSMHGLHDYDPIDMSFLPQWEGLSLSNDKIRAMPSDTLKILIQTILQDLRTRLANMDSSMSPAVGHSVTQAFSFLNRCYLVEPIRYRKVVVEMMGPGSNGSGDAKPHINLNRDQEMAISAAVETFEKRCDEVWKMRENLCDQVKQTRVSRGSELENMRSFIQVHGHMETLQESLRAENEVLVRFLGDVGRILGPAPLTHALFASGGQDIFTYCQAIHCRALMVNSSSLGSGAVNTPNSSAPGGASGSLPGLPGRSQSASWLSGRDGGGSAAITGSIPLVDNLMMPALNDSTAMDLDQQMRDRSTNDHSRRLDSVPPGDSSMHGGGGIRKPPSPAPQHQLITHESPFLYGPGERSQAGGVDNGSQAGVQAAMPSGFRAPKSEPGVNSGQPLNSGGGEFIELFRSIEDRHGRGDSTRLSAGLRSLLKDVPAGGSMSLGMQPDGSPFPYPSVDNPPASSDALPAAGAEGGGAAMLQPTAELLAGLQNNGSPAVKGILSQLLTQQQGQQAQGQAGAASAAGSNTGAASHVPGRAPNLTELETLLHSKEGSRTLEILAQDLTTTRTLSAGELMSIQPEELTQAAAAQAATPSTPTQAQPEVTAPSTSQSPSAQVISGIAPVQRPRSAGVAQVTSGQCE